MYKNITLLLIPILVIALLFIPLKETIVIEKRDTGKILAYFPLKDVHRVFQIEYTHSIHHSEVKETYKVLSNGGIRQTELMYEDTGIGMPANAEQGESFVMENGKYYIRDMKRDFSWIDLGVGQVSANHRLILNKKSVPFSTFTDPGSIVRIKERKLALWQLWKGVNIVGR